MEGTIENYGEKPAERIAIGLIDRCVSSVLMDKFQKARYWQNLEGVLAAGKADESAVQRVGAYFDANVEAKQ